MVSLKDFLKVMEGAEVWNCRSCDDDRIVISTEHLNIHINDRTYSSVEEVYRDVKNPKVVNWTYTDPYANDAFFDIWCKE